MTACKPIVLRTAAALATVVMTTSSFAVSLRPNKATDESVCDLAHDTNLFLGSKVLVLPSPRRRIRLMPSSACRDLCREQVQKRASTHTAGRNCKQRRCPVVNRGRQLRVCSGSRCPNRSQAPAWRCDPGGLRTAVHDSQTRRACRKAQRNRARRSNGCAQGATGCSGTAG